MRGQESELRHSTRSSSTHRWQHDHAPPQQVQEAGRPQVREELLHSHRRSVRNSFVDVDRVGAVVPPGSSLCHHGRLRWAVLANVRPLGKDSGAERHSDEQLISQPLRGNSCAFHRVQARKTRGEATIRLLLQPISSSEAPKSSGGVGNFPRRSTGFLSSTGRNSRCDPVLLALQAADVQSCTEHDSHQVHGPRREALYPLHTGEESGRYDAATGHVHHQEDGASGVHPPVKFQDCDQWHPVYSRSVG